MTTLNTMSVGEIIYRLQEHPLLKPVRKSDIVTHIKTVIELVGLSGLKEEKLIKLDIVDYRAQLPSDFLKRKSVRIVDSTDKIVLTHATDEFIQFNRDFPDDPSMSNVYVHKIIGDYLYVDFKIGKIELAYYTYRTDENGWPLIPRNESLYLAIENYIKARYFGIMADTNANYERSYQRAEQQYCHYVAQATSSLLQPDPVEAQALGEMLTRMIPIRENFYTNDKYSGQPERLNKRLW